MDGKIFFYLQIMDGFQDDMLLYFKYPNMNY